MTLPVVPPIPAEFMVMPFPPAVELVFTKPDIDAVLQVKVPRPLENTMLPTFVALTNDPVSRTVPVGCVITVLAEADEGTATRAVAAKHKISFLSIGSAFLV
jgi:hypothetical protein